MPDVQPSSTEVPVISAESSQALRGPDWETEDAYWQSAYPERTYARADRTYEYYRSAYRYGTESAIRWRGREWDEVESALRTGCQSEPQIQALMPRPRSAGADMGVEPSLRAGTR